MAVVSAKLHHIWICIWPSQVGRLGSAPHSSRSDVV